mgnify:CR=1 FL=1
MDPMKNGALTLIVQKTILNNYENLSQIIGLSIVQSCKKFDIENLKLKWPNDIMNGEKKVCGILVENILVDEKFFYSAIGIGLATAFKADTRR